MARCLSIFIALTLFVGCRYRQEKPDVSHIAVQLQVQRFEQDFFSIDTNQISAAIPALHQKYPLFLGDFVQNILGLSLQDELRTNEAIKIFIRDYSLVKDTADKVFKQFGTIEQQVKQGLQFARYYFPDYKTPEKLITFIGPLDAIFQTSLGKTGDVITSDALAVGLQLHLGKDATLYQSATAQAVFPRYVSQKFEPGYIAVNCIKNVVDDIFPEGNKNLSLLDICVDRGKRLYLLDKFMPDTPDSLKIGYTGKQLKGCMENEGLIWSFIAQNNLLFETDKLRLQSYIDEGPQTQELGEGSPGNISLFVGWQIVKKYMSQFPDTQLRELLQKEPQEILNGSKYKPK